MQFKDQEHINQPSMW